MYYVETFYYANDHGWEVSSVTFQEKMNNTWVIRATMTITNIKSRIENLVNLSCCGQTPTNCAKNLLSLRYWSSTVCRFIIVENDAPDGTNPNVYTALSKNNKRESCLFNGKSGFAFYWTTYNVSFSPLTCYYLEEVRGKVKCSNATLYRDGEQNSLVAVKWISGSTYRIWKINCWMYFGYLTKDSALSYK